MTIKTIVLARRKEGTTHEECLRYLEENHVPLVKQLPNLQRYTTSTPLDPDEAGYDAIGQLWFETAEDLEAALDSPEWNRVLQDAENFVDVEELITVTVDDETLQKQAVPTAI